MVSNPAKQNDNLLTHAVPTSISEREFYKDIYYIPSTWMFLLSEFCEILCEMFFDMKINRECIISQ